MAELGYSGKRRVVALEKVAGVPLVATFWLSTHKNLRILYLKLAFCKEAGVAVSFYQNSQGTSFCLGRLFKESVSLVRSYLTNSSWSRGKVINFHISTSGRSMVTLLGWVGWQSREETHVSGLLVQWVSHLVAYFILPAQAHWSWIRSPHVCSPRTIFIDM